MKKRFITAMVLFLIFTAVVVTTLSVHRIFYDVLILIMMLFAASEVGGAVKKISAKPLSIVVALNIVIGYAAFMFMQYRYQKGGFTAYFLVLGLMFIICLIVNMFAKRLTIQNVVSTMFVMIYPCAIMMYMLGLNYLGMDDNAFRSAAVVMLFVVSPLTDSFAFFVGSRLKGPKLCPAISPKKTISGAIGGLFGGVLGGVIIYLFAISGWFSFLHLGSLGSGWRNPFHYIAIGFLGGIATQIGDLIASYIKRACRIKDYGRLLPGHGGIMDRIDGMLITSVVYYLYMSLLML